MTFDHTSSVSQTSPRARLESLEGMEQGVDDLLPGLPDFSLLTGEESVLGSEASSGQAAGSGLPPHSLARSQV